MSFVIVFQSDPYDQCATSQQCDCLKFHSTRVFFFLILQLNVWPSLCRIMYVQEGYLTFIAEIVNFLSSSLICDMRSSLYAYPVFSIQRWAQETWRPLVLWCETENGLQCWAGILCPAVKLWKCNIFTYSYVLIIIRDKNRYH